MKTYKQLIEDNTTANIPGGYVHSDDKKELVNRIKTFVKKENMSYNVDSLESSTLEDLNEICKEFKI